MSTRDHWGLVGWKYYYPPAIGQVFVSLLEVFFCKFLATFVVAVDGVEGIGVYDRG